MIAQDRIDNAQQNVTETTQQLEDANARIQELSVEKENKTKRINSVQSNLTSTYSELQQLQENLDNKTEKINSLEGRLDEQREDLNQSDTIEGLNSSLDFVCAVYSGDEENAVQEECEEWNHEVGTASES